ncbi:MAG: hypothetical protein U1F25_00100 [Rubrivivax sp.]
MPTRRELANVIRVLAMDAVQQANSGHPGAPMGMADIAEVLWREVLKHNPANPAWWDRDRFVLSNGHASMLLYALLHLTGYAVGMDELRNFRQLGSRTAGHPEHDVAMGIETTTGPLGQGLANAVGMALAEKLLAAEFNRPDLEIVDHRTWVFCGDGCLMEGISHEAGSLAGTLGLGKLVVFYDENGISIDGEVRGWFGDGSAALRVLQLERAARRRRPGRRGGRRAIRTAMADATRPTLICCRTVIGFGAPTRAPAPAKAHGEERSAPRKSPARARPSAGRCRRSRYPRARAPPGTVPMRVVPPGALAGAVHALSQRAPELAAAFESRRMSGELPASWPEVRAAALAHRRRFPAGAWRRAPPRRRRST